MATTEERLDAIEREIGEVKEMISAEAQWRRQMPKRMMTYAIGTVVFVILAVTIINILPK